MCNTTNLVLARFSARHLVDKRLIKCIGLTVNITVVAFTNAAQLQITKMQAGNAAKMQGPYAMVELCTLQQAILYEKMQYTKQIIT